jgi:hypothetical protein
MFYYFMVMIIVFLIGIFRRAHAPPELPAPSGRYRNTKSDQNWSTFMSFLLFPQERLAARKAARFSQAMDIVAAR